MSVLCYLGTFRQPIKPLASLLSTAMSLATFNLCCQSYLACQSNFLSAAFGPRSLCCQSNVHQNQIYLVHRSLFLLRSLRASLPVFIRSSAFHVSFLLSFCPPVSNPLLLGQWFFIILAVATLSTFIRSAVPVQPSQYPFKFTFIRVHLPCPVRATTIRAVYPQPKPQLTTCNGWVWEDGSANTPGTSGSAIRWTEWLRMTGMTVGQSGPNECWTAQTEWLWDTADGVNRSELLGWCTTSTSWRWAHWCAEYVYWQYENISRI